MQKGPSSASDFQIPQFRFLALKGGGSRGFIHLGVAIALKRLGLLDDIDMVAGSSAGAIAALLIATGWSVERVMAELNSLDFQQLIYQEWSFMAPYRLHQSMGLHSGDGLTAWFKKIIKEVTGDENATFLDWHEKKMAIDIDIEKLSQKMKHLYIEACNIQSGFNEEFSHTSAHKDVPIALALSASMAYTGFFTPKEIKGKLYSDGGLQSDCPIMLFEHIQGEPNPLMLAVWLDSLDRLKYIIHGDMPNETEVKNVSQLLYSHAVAMYNVQLRNLARSAYKDKLIYCDTLGVDNLDFDLCAEKRDKLIQSGIYGAVRFFMMNFPEYTSKHFDQTLLAHMHKLNYPISLAEFESVPIMVDMQSPKVSLGASLSVACAETVPEIEDVLSSRWHYLPQFSFMLENPNPRHNLEPDSSVVVHGEASSENIDKVQEDLSNLQISPNKGWCTLI